MCLHKSLLIVTVLLQTLVLANVSFAQERSRIHHAGDLYHELIDRIFPRGLSLVKIDGFQLVIRISPSFRPESQINIEVENRKVRVTEYRAVETNIFYKMEEIIDATGNENLDSIVPQINVHKRVIGVSLDEAYLWRQQFLTNVFEDLRPRRHRATRVSNEFPQVEDGTSFEIWYSDGSELYFQTRGGAKISSRANFSERTSNWIAKIELLLRRRN